MRVHQRGKCIESGEMGMSAPEDMHQPIGAYCISNGIGCTIQCNTLLFGYRLQRTDNPV